MKLEIMVHKQTVIPFHLQSTNPLHIYNT